MIGALHRRMRREQGGFAMIIAVILMAVVASLATLVLTTGTHTDFSTARGVSYTQALHVAEAGVQDAMIRLEAAKGGDIDGVPPDDVAGFDGATDEGTYRVEVRKLTRHRYTIDSAGEVDLGPGLSASRKIRVTLAPPPSFKYALFSYTSVDTKNNDHISGDIWANQNVTVDEGDLIEGGVTAAQGYVRLRNGSRVTKDVQSGGRGPEDSDLEKNSVFLENNAFIGGSVKASVTAPADPSSCWPEVPGHYRVRLEPGALIKGDLTTFGERNGQGDVEGTVAHNVCSVAPGAVSLPAFSYESAPYGDAVEYGTPSAPMVGAVSRFQIEVVNPRRTDMRGTYIVFDAAPVNQDNRIDLSNITVTGDLTIITNAPIFSNVTGDNGSDAVIVLYSSYRPPANRVCDVNQDASECAVHLKNQFQSSGATAMLVVAPYGPVAVKNGAEQLGAIYADNIQIKNQQELIYDPRIERVVGFGPVTLEVQTWLELTA